MCGIFVFDYGNIITAKERFNLAYTPTGLQIRYSIGIGSTTPVVLNTKPKEAVEARFELIPPYINDPKEKKFATFNAKAETIDQLKTYAPLYKKHQFCLVLASGFIESKKVNNVSHPYFFQFKDKRLFAMAGLWSHWKDKEGKKHVSFTIITTTPNHDVKGIHSRMPVVLREEDEAKWLAATEQNAKSFLVPYEDGALESYEISREIFHHENKKEVLAPLQPKGLGAFL